MATEVDDGVTQVWQTGGNTLRISDSAIANANLIEWQNLTLPICTITFDGRVMKDGIDVTNNDEALATCFIELLKIFHGVEVKRDT